MPGPLPAADRASPAPTGTAAPRWALPAALLGAEYLTLSLLVDLPMTGPSMRVVGVVRLLVPVVLGAAAAGWIVARRSPGAALHELAATLPPWRPGPALALHLAAFAFTAALAYALLHDGAPPPTAGAILALLSSAAVTALLALCTAAPLRWAARVVAVRWRLPILAIGLGVASWRAAAASEELWGVLSTATLRAAGWLLEHLAGGVTLDPSRSLLGLRGFSVLVAPVCSGVDGLGLVVLFEALWISLARSTLRFPRALLLLPLGATAALGANVLRITLLVLVGASGRAELAVGAFHSKLGWLLFVAIALGSMAIAERTRWLRRPDASGAGEDGLPFAAAAYLAPLLAALAAGLVASAWSEGPLDRGYAGRAAAGAAALLLVRRSLPRPSLSLTLPATLLGIAVSAGWIVLAMGDHGGALAVAVARLSSPARVAWIAMRLAGSCVVTPVVEELAFRGFLLPWLVSADFERVSQRAWTWPAVLLSSLAFGALHAHWLLGTAAGIAFAAARLWRGKLGDAILAHALCNAAIAAAVLLGGRWELWG
jgi:exosortase E/protease (VPEID-CTERM system)